MTAPDLKLMYSGGSGGFVVLHFLLLLKKYQIDIINNRTIEEIIDSQWNIPSPQKWKSSEVWPENSQTNLLSSPRLFFFCGLNKGEEINDYPGENLVVYTDIDSQIALAQYKHANWFYPKNLFKSARSKFRAWQDHYQNIKDPSWPSCSSWRKVNQLPEHIKNEVISNEYHSTFVNYETTLKYHNFGASVSNDAIKNANNIKYGSYTIGNEAYAFINMSKYSIMLQDFINSNGQELLDQLGLGATTDKQKSLINKWKKLHPPGLLEQIGINI